MQYGIGKWGSNRRYYCLDCQWDVLDDEQRMIEHCRGTGHGADYMPNTTEEFIRDQQSRPPLNVIITLCFLTWNTAQISLEGYLELLEEASRLRGLGAKVNVIVFDNGSTDDTIDRIQTVSHSTKNSYLLHTSTNIGISAARNRMWEWADALDSDFVLFMDGDIEVVPYSVYTMARYLLSQPTVGCIGAYSASYTDKREEASKVLYDIPHGRTRNNIQCAWTQYGLFRHKLWEQGLRFDESGPFGQPGWGLEDDDLYLQMREANWDCRYFNGMVYLHRNMHSSWDAIRRTGQDPKTLYEIRHAYMVSKWKQRGLDLGILKLLEGRGFPSPV